MSGPLGPMDDDGVVDLLRAAGQGGRDASPADVSRAMTAGTKIRRRRQAMQMVGSGLGVAVVLAVGITTVSALDGGENRSTVTAAGDPTAKPEPESKGAPTAPLSTEEQRTANLELLATKLGPDFRVNPEGRDFGDSTTGEKLPKFAVVDVVPGSPTAERVPSGYTMTASGGVPVGALPDGDPYLDSKCKPMVEKGMTVSGCAPVTTSDGHQVQVQEYRIEFDQVVNSVGRPLDFATTTAYFQRVDGSIVETTLTVAAKMGSEVTAATHDNAETLLEDFRDGLVSFAADPKVGPAPGPATGEPAPANPGQPTTRELNQAYLQEALGSTFSLYNGAVTLENNQGRYTDLPSTHFAGTASLEDMTQAQFDAACGEKPGFAGCTSKTLPDGTKVFTNRWADRDASSDELRGETSAYYIRPDATIVVATISLRSIKVTAENRDEQVNGTLAWFDSFQDELIAAATDPRMTFED